jgi:hypothetical protein
MLKSLILNAACLTAAYTFDSTIVPALFDVDPFDELSPLLQLWLAPIIAVALYINVRVLYDTLPYPKLTSIKSLLIQSVASRTFTARHGNNWSASANTGFSFNLNTLSSSLYRAVMIATSLGFAVILGYVHSGINIK